MAIEATKIVLMRKAVLVFSYETGARVLLFVPIESSKSHVPSFLWYSDRASVFSSLMSRCVSVLCIFVFERAKSAKGGCASAPPREDYAHA